MSGLFNFINVLNYLDYRPRYEKDKCIRQISPKAKCSICKDVCQINAIALNKKSITIEDSCDFCNECVSHCPTNALVDTGKRFLKHKTETFILCKNYQVENADESLYIRCLNYINRKILLNMYLMGFREIHTNFDKCKDCSRTNNIEEEINKTNEILLKLDKEPIVLVNVPMDELENKIENIKEKKSNTEVSRRGFFKQLMKETYSVVYETAPPTAKVQFWENEMDILSRWKNHNGESITIYNVLIDNNRCIECEACIKLCPQKVWNICENEKTEDLRLCNGCKLCQDICPGKAIKVVENIKSIKETKKTKYKTNCEKCNKSFETYKEEFIICPTCVGKEIIK